MSLPLGLKYKHPAPKEPECHIDPVKRGEGVVLLLARFKTALLVVDPVICKLLTKVVLATLEVISVPNIKAESCFTKLHFPPITAELSLVASITL